MPTEFQTATELRGLALPATAGAGGFFESKGRYDVAWGDILLALLTPQGSRPQNRAFGTTLYNLLFEPIAEEFELIKLVVRDAVTQWCPHLVLREVGVVAQEKTVQISITFSLRSEFSNPQERAVLIKKTAISNA